MKTLSIDGASESEVRAAISDLPPHLAASVKEVRNPNDGFATVEVDLDCGDAEAIEIEVHLDDHEVLEGCTFLFRNN
jgi:hypothetical protein